MARRKRKHLGSSEAVHKERATRAAEGLRHYTSRIRIALKNGQCARAGVYLVEAAYDYGSLKSERWGMKKPSHSSRAPLFSLAKKVDACYKK